MNLNNHPTKSGRGKNKKYYIMEKEILEGSASIAKFMGYVHIKDNVLYDTCDDTSFKHYTYETVYSKTPIYVDSEDFLQEVKNPDYGNNNNPHWNPNLETLNWASLNEHFINPKYHTSLDWLMPVVDKIKIVSFKLWDSGKVHEKIWLKVDIWSNEVKFIDEETGQYPICTPITSESFIKSLWLAVVQFIQWYNTQSK